MSKLKLMTIVGTRPEVIKMSAIIKKAHQYFDHILVHTGQNYDYELNKIFFDDLGLREPDHYLGVVGENLGQTMGNVISKSYELMSAVKPDAIIVLGDTNSCLCVISAKRLKIPVFHMEAGNRCKDENLPEEVIRRIVDVTSDINLCYSEHARRYILDSGAKPEYTFVVGSPMAEVLTDHKEKIDSSDVLKRLGLEAKKYILLSAHREENINIEENFFSLMNAVNAMAEICLFFTLAIREVRNILSSVGLFLIKGSFSINHSDFLITTSCSKMLFVLCQIAERCRRRVHISNSRQYRCVPLRKDRKLWIRACLQLVRLAQNRYCRQLNL